METSLGWPSQFYLSPLNFTADLSKYSWRFLTAWSVGRSQNFHSSSISVKLNGLVKIAPKRGARKSLIWNANSSLSLARIGRPWEIKFLLCIKWTPIWKYSSRSSKNQAALLTRISPFSNWCPPIYSSNLQPSRKDASRSFCENAE